jgi:hypothetical protein
MCVESYFVKRNASHPTRGLSKLFTHLLLLFLLYKPDKKASSGVILLGKVENMPLVSGVSVSYVVPYKQYGSAKHVFQNTLNMERKQLDLKPN